jgi:hypothetical protein
MLHLIGAHTLMAACLIKQEHATTDAMTPSPTPTSSSPMRRSSNVVFSFVLSACS